VVHRNDYLKKIFKCYSLFVKKHGRVTLTVFAWVTVNRGLMRSIHFNRSILRFATPCNSVLIRVFRFQGYHHRRCRSYKDV